MIPFIDTLKNEDVYLFDGPTGTILYDKGINPGTSYEEVSLAQPNMILELHREYLQSGANILTTNTFSANSIVLKKYNLEDKMEAINRTSVKLAKEVAEDKAYVAGSIGPLGIRIEPYGPTSTEEAQKLFLQQADILIDSGVDLIILETFLDINELLQAIKAIKSFSSIPLVACMVLNQEGLTAYGTPPEVVIRMLDKSQADIVGFNCGVGPQKLVEPTEKAMEITSKPVIVQPNAGLPETIMGRTVYSCTPDYMAKYMRHFIKMGVKYVGCCCGGSPKHIKEISSSIKALKPDSTVVVYQSEKDERQSKLPQAEPIIKEKSELAKDLAEKNFVISVELLPPRGCDISNLIEKSIKLKEMGIRNINIPDGPRAQSRMSSMITCLAIQQNVGIDTIMHYTCRDRNLLGMQSDLLGAAAIGIKNILLITGDPPKMGPYPDSTAVFDVDSIGLTNLVTRFNKGLDIGSNPLGCETNFLVGVGGNPSAVNMDEELRKIYWKVDAGADFIITQPVFEVDKLKKFLDEISKYNIPVIAGLWPLISYPNAEFLKYEVLGVDVPDKIMDRMYNAQTKGKEFATKEGIAIAKETLEAIRNDIAGVQISAPFGRISLVKEVLNL